jgi:hypothetical protein
VRLEFEGSRKDRYDRTRAYVYLEDGTLLNADVIREWYGFVYTLAPFSRMEQFRELERDARVAGRGLWAPAGASSDGGPMVRLAAVLKDFNMVSRSATESPHRECETLQTAHDGARPEPRSYRRYGIEGRGVRAAPDVIQGAVLPKGLERTWPPRGLAGNQCRGHRLGSAYAAGIEAPTQSPP